MTGRVRNKQGRSGVASGIDFDFDFSVDFGSMQLPDQILVRLSAQYVLRREKGASSFGRHVIPCAGSRQWRQTVLLGGFSCSLALFLPDALERVPVSFLVHEAASIGIALGPSLVLRIEDLRAPTYGPHAGVVTDRFVLGHAQLLYKVVAWKEAQGDVKYNT